ncbi:hypothetical protein PUNSTDRAFT_59635 [Punctularia strigosozonata HHB-11173 SS5]|uniref:uncharacterized protein n=1 Tax=Punctularia strigosozonata (strain HHB-11173) TaxID=741275 RepID=UPI00044179DD|nr:uncharacterized protein PUNSTDRAFT_59635 [Punctularia strigosozonata HHB-11173 SS5]EIN14024.1 hypothetical protein PUNSTDRAFT_59635 [Punctularia strigosozonata HHB-11173 SS5]
MPVAVPWKRYEPPLENERLELDEDQITFFKTLTGIYDDQALRRHLFIIQRRAYDARSVYPHGCLRRLEFTSLQIARHPIYPDVQALLRQRPDAILLDMGACLGSDLRKVVFDGWPMQNVVATDVRPAFWMVGHELFNSTPDTWPVPRIVGDVLNQNFLSPAPPFYSPPGTPRPDLRTLHNLNMLRGHVSVIHASNFFHLFDEPRQKMIGQGLAALLTPGPGGIIYGSQGGRFEKGFRMEVENAAGTYMFCHDPETWVKLWDGEIFPKGTVEVKAELVYPEKPDSLGFKFAKLIWSVKRLQ